MSALGISGVDALGLFNCRFRLRCLSGFNLREGVLAQEPPIVTVMWREGCCEGQLLEFPARQTAKTDETEDAHAGLRHHDIARVFHQMRPY